MFSPRPVSPPTRRASADPPAPDGTYARVVPFPHIPPDYADPPRKPTPDGASGVFGGHWFLRSALGWRRISLQLDSRGGSESYLHRSEVQSREICARLAETSGFQIFIPRKLVIAPPEVASFPRRNPRYGQNQSIQRRRRREYSRADVNPVFASRNRWQPRRPNIGSARALRVCFDFRLLPGHTGAGKRF